MNSFFATWLLIVAALGAPEGVFIENNAVWEPHNSFQDLFITHCLPHKKSLSRLSSEEMQCWVSQNHKELNAIAHEHDIQINFEPFGKDGFGSLAIMKLNCTWKHKPVITTDTFIDNDTSHQVKALSFTHDAEIYTSDTHEHPIIKITTKSGDYLWLTITDEHHDDSFDVAENIADIRTHMLATPNKPTHLTVIVPQFTYKGALDISWILGISCAKHYIDQAQQYLEMHLDEQGCRVQSGIGLGFAKISIDDETYHLNKPFYFWIERPGIDISLCEGYITSDVLIKS